MTMEGMRYDLAVENLCRSGCGFAAYSDLAGLDGPLL